MPEQKRWQSRGFRLFIGSSARAQLVYGSNAVAFLRQATLLTCDPVLIGRVLMAPILPWLFFAPPAGVLIPGSFVLALTATPRIGAGAPMGDMALHWPFAVATLGGVALLVCCARSLHLE